MFASNEHLDLTPFDDGKLVDVDFSLAKPLPEPVNVKQQAERLEFEAGVRWMALAQSRRCREAKLAVPVTQVEVEFGDDWGLRGRVLGLSRMAPDEARQLRAKLGRYWNLTFDDLKAMEASADFGFLKAVAKARGFSTRMDGRFFHNVRGDMRVQLRLVFVRLNPERTPGYPAEGRTYSRRVTP